jgi:ankyrin repeat protein
LFRANSRSDVLKGIEEGADIDAQDHFGDTALHWAVEQDKFDVVRALLDYGARTDLIAGGANAFDLAVYLKREQLVQFLRERNAKAHGLFFYDGSINDYEYYLNLGADINAGLDENEFTPLGRLFSSHDWENRDLIEKIRWFLDHGATPSYPNGFAFQPMNQAIECNSSLEVPQLLLDAGAHINASDERGWTPLISAVGCGASFETIEWVLEHGGDATVVDRYGWSVLNRYLVIGRDPRVVAVLLRAGANPGVGPDGKDAWEQIRSCRTFDERCQQIATMLAESEQPARQ